MDDFIENHVKFIENLSHEIIKICHEKIERYCKDDNILYMKIIGEVTCLFSSSIVCGLISNNNLPELQTIAFFLQCIESNINNIIANNIK